jgi:hypothetical protein
VENQDPNESKNLSLANAEMMCVHKR